MKSCKLGHVQRSIERFRRVSCRRFFVLAVILLALCIYSHVYAQQQRSTIRTTHASEVTGVTFSADESLIASGSKDNSVKIWDAATGRELRTLRGH